MTYSEWIEAVSEALDQKGKRFDDYSTEFYRQQYAGDASPADVVAYIMSDNGQRGRRKSAPPQRKSAKPKRNAQNGGFSSRASRGTMTRCRDKRGAFVPCEDRGARLGFGRPDEVRTRGAGKRANRAGSGSRSKMFVIKRDGREVARVSDEEVLRWFHRNVPYSMDHATKYEGYSVEPAGRGNGGARNRNEGRVKRNREGLTWSEWTRAVGVTESEMATFAPPMTEGRLRALRTAWEAGEDPSEWRDGWARAKREARSTSRSTSRGRQNRQSGGGSCGCS